MKPAEAPRRRLRAWLAGELGGGSPIQDGFGARLARGASWSVAGGALSRGLMLLASAVVARLLDQETFGKLGMIQSTVAMLGVFAGLGLGVTATKHVAEFRRRDPERAGRVIALSTRLAVVSGSLLALALWAAAPWLARVTLGEPTLVASLRIAALALFFNSIAGAQTGTLTGFEAFKALARLSTVTGAAAGVMLVLGARFGGLEGTVWALGAGAAFAWFLNRHAVRREAGRAGVPLPGKWSAEEWPVLWRFSLPAVVSLTMVAPVHWACCALLVNRSDGFAEMGVFNAANQWFTALMFLPTLVGQAVLPMMADHFGTTGSHQGVRLLRLAIRLNAVLIVPVIGLAALSPWLMSWFGPEFRPEWPTLVAALATAVLLAVQAPVGQMLIATGNVWPGFWMNVGWAAVYLAMTHLLAGFGAAGLASARLIAYAVHTVWVTWFVVRVLRRGRARAPAG